ncbi:MAG: metallophosphoesterase family protein [Candidatus Krumholzibacteriia bacterium]
MTKYPRGAGCFLLLVVIPFLTTDLGCARQGLVREAYSPDIYEIPRRLPGDTLDRNPRFIIYGDNRPGWRGKQVLQKKSTWVSWWQLLVPFYQVYLIGSSFTAGFNYVRHAPDYGERQARRVRDDMYAQARRSDVDFVINAGDIATDGRRPGHWRTFLRQYKEEVPLALEFPILPVVGNHEMANDTVYGLPNYRDVFSYPQFYVFRCPDVDFFMLDSDILLDQDELIDDDTQDQLFARWIYAGEGAAEPAWLERQLAASDKTFKIVVMHHPPLVFAKKFDDWLNPKFGRNLQQKRRQLLGVLQRYQVPVVFCGHQHMYEHSVMSYQDAEGGTSKMHEIITGGGGSPLHNPYDDRHLEACAAAYEKQGLDAVCIKQESIYNYCLVNVTSDRIEIQVFEVTESPAETGRVVDTITISR